MSKAIDDSEQLTEFNLFKFRAINKHLLDCLVMSHLWCAKVDTLNDPLDCQVDLHEAYRRAVSTATGEKKLWLQRFLDHPDLFEKLEKPLRDAGICSFSQQLDTHLSWSHYADEHKGVCLVYRFPASFFHDRKNNIVGISEVTYDDNSLTNWLLNSPSDIDEFLTELIKKYFTVKSPAWSHEQEMRIIRFSPGLLDIPSGFLEKVCFGLRTPSADIELVKKLAEEHCGCNNFCRIIRDTNSDFGIKVVDM